MPPGNLDCHNEESIGFQLERNLYGLNSNPFKSFKKNQLFSEHPQPVIVPLLCPLGSVEPWNLVPHPRPIVTVTLEICPRCHPPKHTHGTSFSIFVSKSRLQRRRNSAFPKNHVTLKRSMAYGSMASYILYMQCMNLGGFYYLSVTTIVTVVYHLLKIEETCFSAFGIHMSPQQHYLGTKQAPTPPTSGFVI